MRNRNNKSIARIVITGLVLLAATTANAQEDQAPRFHDEASAEQVAKGNYVLARQPQRRTPRLLPGAGSDAGLLRRLPGRPRYGVLQAGAGEASSPLGLVRVCRCSQFHDMRTGRQRVRSVQYGMELSVPGSTTREQIRTPGALISFSPSARQPRPWQPRDNVCGLHYAAGSPDAHRVRLSAIRSCGGDP